jgi:release factor glutamine methyltransferase
MPSWKQIKLLDWLQVSIKELLRTGKARLAEGQISGVDAELLLAHYLGVGRTELHAKSFDLPGDELEVIAEQFTKAIAQRLTGTPTQYIIGSAPFRYLEFDVGPGVLIPRPETEPLVDEVLHQLGRFVDPISVIDLGAGSGAIALSIASETAGKRRVHVIAVEKSDEAADWLKKNIAKHDLDIRVVIEDVSSALPGVKADVVVANPPYIPADQHLPAELAFEPSDALIGGPGTGMEIPNLFIEAAARLLKSGGLFAMEHHEEQAAMVASALGNDFEAVVLHQDLTGRPRFTTATRR